MVADSERDADMLYATGLFVPDPFIYLHGRSRPLLVLSDLEIDRARKQAPHCRVASLGDYQKKLRRNGVKSPRFPDVIRELLRERKIPCVTVPENFAFGLAADLQQAGIRVRSRRGNFFPERE